MTRHCCCVVQWLLKRRMLGPGRCVLNVGQGLLRCLRTRASATTFAFKHRAKEIHYVEAHVLCAPLFKRPTQCHANAKRQAKSKHSPFKGVRRANWFLGEFRSIPQLSKSWHNGSRVVWAVPECVTRTVHLNRHARAHFASRTQCSSHLTPTFRAGAMHWHVDTLSQSKLGLAGVATPPQHPSSQTPHARALAFRIVLPRRFEKVPRVADQAHALSKAIHLCEMSSPQHQSCRHCTSASARRRRRKRTALWRAIQPPLAADDAHASHSNVSLVAPTATDSLATSPLSRVSRPP